MRPLLPSCPRVIATWGGRQQHGCYSASCCLAPDDEIGSNEVKEGSPEWRAFCRIAIATALPRGPAVASPATQESSALCINDRSKDGLRRSRPRQGPRPVARRGSDALIAEDHHPCRPRDDWESVTVTQRVRGSRHRTSDRTQRHGCQQSNVRAAPYAYRAGSRFRLPAIDRCGCRSRTQHCIWALAFSKGRSGLRHGLRAADMTNRDWCRLRCRRNCATRGHQRGEDSDEEHAHYTNLHGHLVSHVSKLLPSSQLISSKKFGYSFRLGCPGTTGVPFS